MMLPKLQVVQLHLEGGPQVSRSKHQASPLSRNGKKSQIYQAGDDKGPGKQEMPVEPTGEPATQPRPLWYWMAIQRIGHRQEITADSEVGVGVVDLEPARNHADQEHSVEPMRQADNSGVPPDEGPKRRELSVFRAGERLGWGSYGLLRKRGELRIYCSTVECRHRHREQRGRGLQAAGKGTGDGSVHSA